MENQELWSAPYVMDTLTRPTKGLQKRGQMLLHWWFRLTSVIAEPEHTGFRQREAGRRSQLISVFLLCFLGYSVIMTPFWRVTGTAATLGSVLLVLVISCIALAYNRRGRVVVAGLLVIALMVLLSGISLLSSVQPTLDLSAFYLLVLAELLAISLLPIESIFLLVFINSLMLLAAVVLHYDFSLLALRHLSLIQWYTLLLRPILLQLLLASIAYFWAQSLRTALQRADRAEIVAALEHAMVEQEQGVARQKHELDEGIRELVEAHQQAVQDGGGQVPLVREKSLLPLVSSLNTLFARMKRLQQQANELERTREEAKNLAAALRAARTGELLVPLKRSGTVIDLITFELNSTVATTESLEGSNTHDKSA